MVTASFKEGQKTAITTSLQKYDYGEVLRIKGLSLPRYVAVQFAVDGMSEALPSSIGETVEDVTDVLIPNSLLRSNIKPWNYNIMAYVYIVSGSSGKTEYTITIPVKWRPKTGDDQAADDDVAAVIGSAVEKMNTATTKAENAANQASATAEEIKADREKITTNEIKIAGLKSDLVNLDSNFLPLDHKEIKQIESSNLATKYIDGAYVTGVTTDSDGNYILQIKQLEGYSYTDFIDIEDLDYVFSNSVTIVKCILCDKNKRPFYPTVDSQSLSTFAKAVDRPKGTKYIVVSLGTNKKENFYIKTVKNKENRFINISTVLGLEQKLENLPKNPNIVTVGLGKDFTKISDAILSITDASSDNRYVVKIDSGNYNIIEEIGLDYINTQTSTRWQGLYVSPYIDFEGIGDVTINGELPADLTGHPNIVRNNVSLLNVGNRNNFKNIAFIMKNMRYCVHSDNSDTVDQNANQVYEKCKFIVLPYEGIGYQDAMFVPIGIGMVSGVKIKFTDCEFIRYNTDGSKPEVVIHDMHGNTSPVNVTFDNCSFTGGEGQSVKISSAGSKQKNVISFIGCLIDGYVRFDAETSNADGKNDWIVEGYGNTGFAYRSIKDADVGKNVLIDSVIVSNGTDATIVKGTPLKRYYGQIRPMVLNDSYLCFYGVAMEDIALNKIGCVRTFRGGITCEDIGLSKNLDMGTKIGIENNTLKVVTGSEFIGIVKNFNWIQFN